MQSIVNSKEFFELRGIVDIFVNKVRTIEMDFNQNTREIYNLEKYEIIPEGNEEQVLGKYKEMYDKLAKIIIDKDKSITEGNESINQFESMVYYLQQLTSKNSFSSITYKEQKCVNELKDCVNAIVNKIEAKEREIFNKQSKKREKDFNKKLKQLEKMKFSKYEIQVLEPQVESEEKAEEELERIKELNSIKATVIDDSMDILKHWSNKTKYTILFDSSNDGDGSKNVLCNKVLNKSCLYFISFDDKGNVYGGYVPSAISSTSSWQQDKNSFLFSLSRNGSVKYKKYDLRRGYESFRLHSKDNLLYEFGDIGVYKVGMPSSYCNPQKFDFGIEQFPLVGLNYPKKFSVERIVVIQMK